jgi:hypothetical protein
MIAEVYVKDLKPLQLPQLTELLLEDCSWDVAKSFGIEIYLTIIWQLHNLQVLEINSILHERGWVGQVKIKCSQQSGVGAYTALRKDLVTQLQMQTFDR